MTTGEKHNLQIHGDRATLESRAARGEILRLEHGGVVWFEEITIDNRHAIKSATKEKLPSIETRGRTRGDGRGGHNRHEIPIDVVIALKERGLSGSEIARELFDLGYGEVSRDYANRRLREAGYTPDLQQRGGRPRKG